MELDLNIAKRYRLTLGTTPNNVNAFAITQIDDNFCILCDAGKKKKPMGQIWSYYGTELRPHLNGLKVVFYDLTEEDIKCSKCKLLKKDHQTSECDVNHVSV